MMIKQVWPSRQIHLLNGYEIFHNYIRTHEGLDDKTPSEACGIEINRKNKWITLIQNASRKDS